MCLKDVALFCTHMLSTRPLLISTFDLRKAPLSTHGATAAHRCDETGKRNPIFSDVGPQASIDTSGDASGDTPEPTHQYNRLQDVAR
jgi:hypothetical protein